MKKVISKPLTKRDLGALKALERGDDRDIDTRDIPEVRDWKGAKRGVFYRPVKQQLTLRLDADVVDWFKRQGEGYQTRINAVLRKHVRRKAG
jgi:uncharacterized protein (DUF4415 family)